MIYIVIALKSEAQAFVEHYKLSKSKLHSFTLFTNTQIKLIISGIGVTNARVATQTLINEYDITDDDIYCNIGICGASPEYPINSLLEFGEITYDGIPYLLKPEKLSIHCVDIAVQDFTYEIVDMESFGFYDAVFHNPAIKRVYILKVVSDHFEPKKVTKDGTKKLISKNIDAINHILFPKD